ncbi:MAG TPA: hypothetical protein VJN18_13495 [Polyangiaceae bacterium]|nr:hypothetical protein [Polyangiaceae bacterium]
MLLSSALVPDSAILGLDPDIRFASEAPLESSLPKDEVVARVFALDCIYTREISQFLGQAPTLQSRPKPPRKEKERDLFAAAG